MPHELEHYETMCRISIMMLEAARQNDWTRLGLLEAEVAGLRDHLQALGEAGKPSELSESQRARKRELIQLMLDHDREIRQHTEPWMASMRRLFAGASIEKNLRKAYGTGH
ncbi:flagellar protein FliT [Viridibacterium curvum]|uniref:Flagellar protein FliT n=1 Tax=Viridibacterium curvum TaxID=1101404 RepID=A0ABP9QCY0_9RHOO